MPASATPAAPRHPPALRTAGMALFLLTSLNLFNFIDRYVLPGVQPLIQREFHIDDAQAGLLTSAFFITYMLHCARHRLAGRPTSRANL